MRSLISKLRLDRIVKVLSGKTVSNQADPVEVITSVEAVAVLENLVSDAIVRNSLNEESSGSVSGTNPSGMNIFGDQMTDIRCKRENFSLDG